MNHVMARKISRLSGIYCHGFGEMSPHNVLLSVTMGTWAHQTVQPACHMEGFSRSLDSLGRHRLFLYLFIL